VRFKPVITTQTAVLTVCVASFFILASILTFNPTILVPTPANGLSSTALEFPVGPLSPPPPILGTGLQNITLTEAESHYCPGTIAACKAYPSLRGTNNDFYEAKVQPNGWGTTWYVHFPTTHGNVTNNLVTTQSVDPTGTNLTVNLMAACKSPCLPLSDRLALVYSFDVKNGYEEVAITNLTAIPNAAGNGNGLLYSNAVQTGDVFQFLPFPNGAMIGSQTALGNCKTGVPLCLYSNGYIVYGEASLTRTCVFSSSATSTHSGTSTSHTTVPSGDCALSSKCAVHSTTTTVASTTTIVKSMTCTYSYSTSCSSTNTSITFTSSAKLPGCDESNWTSASVLHNWGDTTNYQSLDTLENSWEITAASSGTPIVAIHVGDVTSKYGNRTQVGSLEWLDKYSYEPIRQNTNSSTYYRIAPSSPPSTSNCKSFALWILTSRGNLSGTISVTPYIGTGCPLPSKSGVVNPYVGYLSGTLKLGGLAYTVNGVAVEFLCNRTLLPNCSLPVLTSTNVSCGALAAGQPTSCTATVSDTSGSILPFGAAMFSSNDTQTFSILSCVLPGGGLQTGDYVTGTGASASCTFTFTPKTQGHVLLTVKYEGDDQGVHKHSSVSVTFPVS
jgi:hypothetical protein